MTAPTVTRSLGIGADDRTALRIVADALAGPLDVDRLHLDLRELGLTPHAAGEILSNLVHEPDDCPECAFGVVEAVGRPEWDTGHQPYACSARCGFSG